MKLMDLLLFHDDVLSTIQCPLPGYNGPKKGSLLVDYLCYFIFAYIGPQDQSQATLDIDRDPVIFQGDIYDNCSTDDLLNYFAHRIESDGLVERMGDQLPLWEGKLYLCGSGNDLLTDAAILICIDRVHELSGQLQGKTEQELSILEKLHCVACYCHGQLCGYIDDAEDDCDEQYDSGCTTALTNSVQDATNVAEVDSDVADESTVPLVKSDTRSEDPAEADEPQLPPALNKLDRVTLRALTSMDPSSLSTVAQVVESIPLKQRYSYKSIALSINKLIDMNLAERPQGKKQGVRLTTRGRLLASKITD